MARSLSHSDVMSSLTPSTMSEIDLPHLMDGEIDWKTLGNILSAHLLGEVLEASYVDYKYGMKNSEFKAATDWEFFYEESDVMVFRKQFVISPIHAWMGRCVIDRPVKDVVDFIQDLSNRKYFDKYLQDIEEVQKISDEDVIVYLHLKATQCLVKQQRDLIYYERQAYVGDKFVRSALSVDVPEFPVRPGIPRGQIQAGTGYVMEPWENNKTLITFGAHVDLKNLPPLIINRAARRSPMAVYHIREFLTNAVYRKKYHPAFATFYTQSDQPSSDESHCVSSQLQDHDSSRESYSRFFQEEQLSVRDFISNKPALKRNVSVPSYLDNSTGMDAGFARARSRSDGAYLTDDCDDDFDETKASNNKASIPIFRSVPVSDIHQLQSHEFQKIGTNFEASESTYYADTVTSYEESEALTFSGRSLSDSVFATPQASDNEQSLSQSQCCEASGGTSHLGSPGHSNTDTQFIDPLGALADPRKIEQPLLMNL